MATLPKIAACTIEPDGRPGKTITRAAPGHPGYQGSKQKEQFQP